MSPAKMTLDTNVLVSALINSFGAPGTVLDLTLSGELTVTYDDRIMAEWRDVLHRERFGFARRDVEALLEFLEVEGFAVNAPPLGLDLPDMDDLPFLEVAHSAGALPTTGNLKHYPLETQRREKVTESAALLHGWSA